MKKGFLSEYFVGVAVKHLSAVEADSTTSNQHEFNGVKSLVRLFGEERLTDYPARFIWLGSESEGISEDSYVTWYDSREKQSHRTSEYRLYFKTNSIMDLAGVGDFLVICKDTSENLVIIVATEGTTSESQLRWLFGIPEQIETKFEVRGFDHDRDIVVGFAARFMLEELGIELEEPDAGRLDELVERFNGVFPSTAVFSAFARDTLPEVDPREDPDASLLEWMDQEEKLFRRLEAQVVSARLEEGFRVEDKADVDGFISYSLSVQNRRKSRAGYALEHHLDEIFRECDLRYDRQAVTENNARPDFLFPGAQEYHNEEFSSDRLFMLGVKTTCKDRWRQVLSEAHKIRQKHLFTLEPAISVNQTLEMQQNNLQLVIPAELHSTYSFRQQEWLVSLAEFISRVQE